MIERSGRYLLLEYRTWEKDKHQDFIEDIGSTKGPIIEVGGPTLRPENLGLAYTLRGYIGIAREKDKVFISNVFGSNVDFRADARSLPFESETIGAIYASALPVDITRQTILEAYRVCETGGFLVFNDGTYDGICIGLHVGFELIYYTWSKSVVEQVNKEGNCVWRSYYIFHGVNFILVKSKQRF